MSKERELLQRCLDEFEYKGVACNELCIDINKLLAQPETKQEPVAWQLVANFITDGDILQYTYSKPRDELYEYYRVTPLYTSPPTREPLSDGEIRDGLDGKNGFENWYDDRFVDGVRFAEKAHGIVGGE